MAEVVWYWWEVQFSDRRLSAKNESAIVLEACVERLELEDVDHDINTGKPLESTHFIESDVFCVVKTVTDEPLDAVKRAMMQLRPDILASKEDVQWANIGC